MEYWGTGVLGYLVLVAEHFGVFGVLNDTAGRYTYLYIYTLTKTRCSASTDSRYEVAERGTHGIHMHTRIFHQAPVRVFESWTE